ncbi:quinolinate synthase NadA [Brevundimonas sp. 2R-24]|uniref:Quinolinate synthase n=1 Tax=Peiella sedimenti TaxID=3061083 RepID=A0ABT8SPE0_9CAUL|nr:quinolinate synthase NadA [Caulobacteraceae bacterium XZ-24]
MADGGFTAAVERETSAIWDKVKERVSPLEWRVHAPLIAEINALKRERNAVILAHNYMTPEIFHGVGDFVGDSLGLAREAAACDAAVIVQAGVLFMAETSKVLAPDKTVLIPDLRAGCSLASSITAADVRLIRQRHPTLPIVAYVNTTAEVKAEVDICCTSANAVQVVEHAAREWGVDTVILLPDEHLSRNVAAQTRVRILAWKGACEVHQRFDAQDVRDMRAAYPDAEILAHPECPADVLAEADFAGSTAAMADHVARKGVGQVVLLTECSMADNLMASAPGVQFLKPCNLCPHMKRITLEGIRDCLVTGRHEVTVDPGVAERARLAVQRMIDLPTPPQGRGYARERLGAAVDLLWA